MYKYETHLHTSPVSRCGKASVRESLEFYKNAGYDGVFITNHFLGGNINIDPSRPYAEKIEFYFSDYEAGLEIGKELGIKVFCGVELSNHGPDFLVYGLDKQWYLDHPEIMEMALADRLKFMMDSGALVIQAHPFRENTPIALYHRCVHGVEILNANDVATHELAKHYCEHYGLLPFAGSDNHTAGRKKLLAGICCRQPIESMEDFIEKVRSRQVEIFSAENP
jgi:predicted metal-dependent phosphoesterase TrpH